MDPRLRLQLLQLKLLQQTPPSVSPTTNAAGSTLPVLPTASTFSISATAKHYVKGASCYIELASNGARVAVMYLTEGKYTKASILHSSCMETSEKAPNVLYSGAMTYYELPGDRAWTNVYLHVCIIHNDANGKDYRVTIVFDDVNIDIKYVHILHVEAPITHNLATPPHNTNNIRSVNETKAGFRTLHCSYHQARKDKVLVEKYAINKVAIWDSIHKKWVIYDE